MEKLQELTDRQRIILKAIIKTYLASGEPVGSRTLSKLPNFDISPATIRNEMADLEELGYLISPHTSAGRVPTDKGYRFYVDNLLIEKELEIESFKNEMFQKVDRLENMLKGLVKTLASNTNYPAIISGPTVFDKKIKYIQISKIENLKLLSVVVCEANIIKTSLIAIEENIQAEEIVDIQQELNNLLSGLKAKELITEEFKEKIRLIKKHKQIINSIIDSITESLNESQGEMQELYTYGMNNIFKYPELTNENAEEILRTFETKDELKRLINIDNQKIDNSLNSIQVYIGEESAVPSMKNCSIITAKCDFGEGIRGTIGVIGPKRMDYEKVLRTVKDMITHANKTFKEE